jgi:hypothetical protein
MQWGGKQFEYEIRPNGDVHIVYGSGNQFTILSAHWNAMLAHFGGQLVPLGTSHNVAQPVGSVGAWLVANVTPTALGSYVGPILISEGHATRPNSKSSDIQFH